MKTPEDEAFDAIEHAKGWRKRQIEQSQALTPQQFYDKLRNEVLEEIATEFDNMLSLGDTAASFAVFVRSMKK